MWGMFCSVPHMDQPTATRVAVVCSWLHALYKFVISPPPHSDSSCKLYVMSATLSLATKPPIVTGTVR